MYLHKNATTASNALNYFFRRYLLQFNPTDPWWPSGRCFGSRSLEGIALEPAEDSGWTRCERNVQELRRVPEGHIDEPEGRIIRQSAKQMLKNFDARQRGTLTSLRIAPST